MLILNKERLAAIFGKTAEWSLYILIFMLPISKSIIEITTITALASVFAIKIISRVPFKKLSAPDVAIIMFALATVPSLFNSCDYLLSIKALFSKTFKFALFAIIISEIIDNNVKLRNLLTMALLSAVIISADGFIQYFVTHRDILHFDGMKYLGYPSFQFSLQTINAIGHSPYPYGFRGFPTASFPFPNDFATWILICIFPTLTFLVQKSQRLWKRIVLGLVAGSLAFLLILTKTRSAWVGFAVACLVLPFFRLVHMKRMAIIVVIIAICGSAIIIGGSFLPYVTAIAGIADRQIMWNNAWQIFKEHPIIGSGLNTFFVRYMHIRNDEFKDKRGSYAHNCYLQMAAETGAIGLLAFIGMAIVVIFTALRSFMITDSMFLKSCIAGLVLGTTAYLVQSFFDTNLYSLNLAALFWMVIGVLISISKMTGKCQV